MYEYRTLLIGTLKQITKSPTLENQNSYQSLKLSICTIYAPIILFNYYVSTNYLDIYIIQRA